MKYSYSVQRNWPIGSGVTEAACKTLIKHRLCKSGSRLEGRWGSRRIVDTRTATHYRPLGRVLAEPRPIWLPNTPRVTSYCASTPDNVSTNWLGSEGECLGSIGERSGRHTERACCFSCCLTPRIATAPPSFRKWAARLRSRFPAHAFARPVPGECHELCFAVAIQPLDRIVQASLWIDVARRREGVVDATRPTFFLERAEDDLLVPRRQRETLDDPPGKAEHTQVAVPSGRIKGSRNGRHWRHRGGRHRGGPGSQADQRRLGPVAACQFESRVGQHEAGVGRECRIYAERELAVPVAPTGSPRADAPRSPFPQASGDRCT